MSFKIAIRLPFNKMEPAYDLAFQPDILTFRTYEKLRRPGIPGESRFWVYPNRTVICHDTESPDLENEFPIIQADYDRLVKMYKEGLERER